MGKTPKPQSARAASSSGSAAQCIVPNLLYLGPASAASNTAFMQREGITHVISVGKSPTSPLEGITYERLRLTDQEGSAIDPVAARACDIIDAASASQGRVLVHCSAAISRSPTIVAAYLMKRRGMTLRESLERLVSARHAVSPNPGFLRQLSEIEKEVFGGTTTFNPEEVTSKTRLASLLIDQD